MPDVLLEGGPRHQHWVRLPDPLPDALVEDTGEYVRAGDSGEYIWTPRAESSENTESQGSDLGEYVESDSSIEHIRPAPRARVREPREGDSA